MNSLSPPRLPNLMESVSSDTLPRPPPTPSSLFLLDTKTIRTPTRLTLVLVLTALRMASHLSSPLSGRLSKELPMIPDSTRSMHPLMVIKHSLRDLVESFSDGTTPMSPAEESPLSKPFLEPVP